MRGCGGKSLLVLALLAFGLPTLVSAADKLARYQPEPYVRIKHPDWSRNAVLYQLNTRQFSPDGW